MNLNKNKITHLKSYRQKKLGGMLPVHVTQGKNTNIVMDLYNNKIIITVNKSTELKI